METLPFDEEIPAIGLRKDCFQTPPSAVEAILPMLPKYFTYWEPCAGKGNIVNTLRENGYKVGGSDIQGGTNYSPFMRLDFLQCSVPDDVTAIITNPPYSLYGAFIQRCGQLSLPFALLVPLSFYDAEDRVNAIQAMKGIDVIYPSERTAFETPTGRKGKDSSPQMLTVWICKGFYVDLLRQVQGKAVYLR